MGDDSRRVLCGPLKVLMKRMKMKTGPLLAWRELVLCFLLLETCLHCKLTLLSD